MLPLAANGALALGILLELCGAAFWGLDLLVGLCFAAAIGLAVVSQVSSEQGWQGTLTAAASTFALVFHIWLNSL